MQLIAPDVLESARGLSNGAAAFLALVGLLLWLTGWRWHRFWIVFGITLTAGLIGLSAGHSSGGRQVMVIGVLLAVSAGLLALELAKVLSFVTGGMAAWAGTQSIFPQSQELWPIFLAGGLVGVLLYQLWTMLTTSFLGVLITWHFGLILIDNLAKSKFVAVEFAQKNAQALNGGVIAVTIIGVFVQAWITVIEPVESPSEPSPAATSTTAWLRGLFRLKFAKA